MTDAWADATSETTPFHIWRHEVELAAIRLGASGEAVRAVANEFAAKWFRAGEPVRMAAESIAFVAKRRAIEAKANKEMLKAMSAISRWRP